MISNYLPTTEWPAIDPATVRMDAKKLAELEPLIKSDYSNINGIVVVRHGYLAYEKYFNNYGSDDTHHVASVTKSVLSALVGIAIEAGYINDVNQKVLDFFPEYVPSADDQQKREITIRHLLTMTAPYPFEDWQEPLDQLCMQPDWVKYTLDILGKKGKIGAFKYSTAGAHLLSAILTRSTGKSAREFANERLFKPIGMQEIPDHEMQSFSYDDLFGKKVRGWVKDPNGISTGGWGLTLHPRDMARFGLLYLNHGIWGTEPIISNAWIEESTRMNPYHYGYLWWLREENGIFAYSAIGDAGNVICCIPEKDLVVAISSQFMMNPRDRWALIKEQILSTILA
ncbi:penicillin-binding protein [Brevibacillus reuszeri]|uniref:6-aminohexanoate hydrolase n=1 Tax=Brevibacillus reuszeri TaxID=54915 RepID=A0A0K9YP49_9BACL|nr:serine hydrolase [Brevibacillus reuszeri]KNB70422.1 6-aminohexanoate hydrolase [Brevibacillus reuszeri]MED1857956.1 serine hydrolase [Brevibacillus reuszeri]GED71831.1 penicillin-binding protein [Brevibacillus reuszeri]